MLVRPNYEKANEVLKTIWRCIERHRQDIRDQWSRFEQQPASSVDPILHELNAELNRIKFVCGALFPHCTGATDPNTGDIVLNPKLIWDTLKTVHEGSDTQLKNCWSTLVDTLLHELIHQAQRDQQPEIFATYHKEQAIVNAGKSFHYCQASSRYEIQAHAYTDATRIRRRLKNSTATLSLDRAKAMICEANVFCPPNLFYKELLHGEVLAEAPRILEEYQSTACAYLEELDKQPEPEMFVPDLFCAG
jgi:hypothetical protein